MSPPAARQRDLDGFLDWLRAAGYGVDVRERLLAHALLARYAESGGLPEDLAERLRLLEPLLSRNEQEQRRFEGEVTAFLQQPRSGPTPPPPPPPAPAVRLVRIALAAVAVIGLAALLWWFPIRPDPPPGTTPPPVKPDSPGVTVGNPVLTDTTVPVSPVYVPIRAFPDAAALSVTPAPRLPGLRWAVGALGAVLALALLAWLVRRRSRAAYLQGVRTYEEVENHVLRDPDPIALAVPDATVRPASRMLRQRIAGSRQVLDLRATLQATMRAGGALAARYRPLHQTPEYLVLVDRVSARDHQAAFHELLVRALGGYGVAVDLFYYEGSPARGCWRPRPGRGKDAAGGAGRALSSVAQLSNRYGSHRLLVFGDAACAFEPLSGRPAAWIHHVRHFPGLAWFSPLPVASWGRAEAGVDGLGFLLLPAQPESLESLAEWLAADRATLRAEEDWPGAYPASLRGGGAAAWVARQAPPPREAVQDLMFELRAYLGPARFQWLCACAVFPTVSWPLTLSLGREVLRWDGGSADAGALARGVAALGALPWFRYGRMPAWLRESLLDRVDPEREERLRGVVERRLASAMTGGTGEKLEEVAVRRRRLAAWFSRRRGMAQDVVLAGFLEKGLSRRLAQRIPPALQRLLFRGGRPLYGVRGVVPAAGALVSALCLTAAALPGAWERLAGRASDGPALEAYTYLGGHRGVVTSVAFSPDGQRVLTTADDGTARVWPADGSSDPVMLRITPDGTNAAAFSPDGQWIVTASPDNAVRLWRADGTGTPRVLRGPSGRPSSVTIAAFSPDGELVLAVFQDTDVEVWRADGPGGSGVLHFEAGVAGAAFSQDGQQILIVANDGTGRVLQVDGSGGRVVFRGAGPVSRADFTRDLQRIVTVAGDSAARVWRDGAGTPVVLRHPGMVSSAVFSPDGEQVATTSVASGAVRVWRTAGPGKPLVLRGHTEAGHVVAFSPDGRHIVTTSFDGTARLFRADGSAGSIVLQGHTSPVPAGATSPDGQRVAIGYIDGVVRLWGRPPRAPVNLLGCNRPRALGASRTLADTLAQDTVFSPVVYLPSAWDSVRLGAPPAPGEVRYAADDPRSRILADTLVARLGRWRPGSGALPWRAVGAEVPAGALSIGVCQRGAIPGDSVVQVSVYYKAADDSSVARQVAQGLANRGYRINIVALRPNAANTGAENIRYFRRDDLPIARTVQGVVREALAAAGVGGFQPRLEDRSRSGEAVPRDRVEVWLPPLDSWRARVRIQVHSRETDLETVLAALRELRFPVTRGPENPGVPPETPTNAIWYGTGVPLEDVKLVAQRLMQAGVQIRMISPFVPPRARLENMIQVGSLREEERYGSTTLRDRPYSAEEVRAATSFPIR